MAKLKPQPVFDLSGITEESRKQSLIIENMRIEATNKKNKEESDAKLLEMRNRVYIKLSIALKSKAPLLLGKLKGEYPEKDEHGAIIPDAYDGIAMFVKGLAGLLKEDMREYDRKKYQAVYEKIRDSKCPDNSTPEMYSKRIDAFLGKVNPFLETPLIGDKLGLFLLSQLPESAGADERRIKEKLVDEGKLGDPSAVLAKALEVLEALHKPNVLPTP